jgi:hypothetical protein
MHMSCTKPHQFRWIVQARHRYRCRYPRLTPLYTVLHHATFSHFLVSIKTCNASLPRFRAKMHILCVHGTLKRAEVHRSKYTSPVPHSASLRPCIAAHHIAWRTKTLLRTHIHRRSKCKNPKWCSIQSSKLPNDTWIVLTSSHGPRKFHRAELMQWPCFDQTTFLYVSMESNTFTYIILYAIQPTSSPSTTVPLPLPTLYTSRTRVCSLTTLFWYCISTHSWMLSSA